MVSHFKRVISGTGRRIKRCRLALGISKAQLAAKAGLTRPAITYYENRHVTPTLQSLKKLADALAVSVDYLIGLENDAERSADMQLRLLFKDLNKLSEKEISFMEEMCERLRKSR